MIAPFDHNEIAWNKYQDLPDEIRFYADVAILLFEPVNYFQFEDLLRNIKTTKTPKFYFTVFSAFNKAGITDTSDFNVLSVLDQIKIRAFPQLFRKKEYAPVIEKIKQFFPLQAQTFGLRPVSPLRYLRNYIIGCFSHDKVMMQAALKLMQAENSVLSFTLAKMLHSQLYDEVLLQLPAEFQKNFVHTALIPVVYHFQKADALYNYIARMTLDSTSPIFERFHMGIKAGLKLFEGNLAEAAEIAQKYPSTYSGYVNSICLMYNGDFENAKKVFSNEMLLFRQKNAQNKYFPDIHFGFYYLLLLILHQPENHKNELLTFEKLFLKSGFPEHKLLLALVYIGLGKKFEADEILEQPYFVNVNTCEYFDAFIFLFIVYLSEGKFTSGQIKLAKELYAYALAGNKLLIVLELGWVLAACYEKPKEAAVLGYASLLSLYKRKEAWEDLLISLLAISGNESGVKKEKAEGSRLVYLVDFDNKIVLPVLQTRKASGWSKGRNVALKKLKNSEVDNMTSQDLKIAATISNRISYYGADYSIDFDKMLPELVRHPLLFYFANPEIPVELVNSPPELITEEMPKGYKIQCNVTETGSKQVLIKETNTRYKYIELTDEQLIVIRALNHHKPLIPEKGKEKLFKTLAHVSSFMTVHSDYTVEEENVKSVQADSRIRVQILPVGGSLKAECFVKPFGTVPPYSKPGKGGKTVYGILENEKCIVSRNFLQESENMMALANALSEVGDADFISAPVMFSEPQECLSLLEILRANQDIAVVEWPEGERFRVRQSLSFQQLKLKVNSRGNWFELSGELKLDENKVLTLQQLLTMRNKSKGRFIEIGDNEFVALSAELKKRLDELMLYSLVDKKEIKVNKFAAHALEEITQNAGSFKTDKAWTEFQKKIRTRLRLACCNISLVDSSQKLPSAKLETFFEIVDELLENKHRALVFSQFIGHLDIVRKFIEKRKISYQYLDESTPIQERTVIVRNFQEGAGDLFLISLKAGELGLNLTGADYVIHLDPWWNPAIEDQASDRAHRIGQTRPVTIYRLVAKDTIEEKIIQLHHSKRDMADSLLEGTDQSAKLSTSDLLNLLKDL